MTTISNVPLNTLLQLSGCALWLGASDPSTVITTGGSNVTQWNDKSGNGKNLTTQGNSSFITYTKNNNINSLFFNNSSVNNAYMNNTSFSNPASASIFIVFTPIVVSLTWNFIYSWKPLNSSYLLPGLRLQTSNSNL